MKFPPVYVARSTPERGRPDFPAIRLDDATGVEVAAVTLSGWKVGTDATAKQWADRIALALNCHDDLLNTLTLLACVCEQLEKHISTGAFGPGSKAEGEKIRGAINLLVGDSRRAIAKATGK